MDMCLLKDPVARRTLEELLVSDFPGLWEGACFLGKLFDCQILLWMEHSQTSDFDLGTWGSTFCS